MATNSISAREARRRKIVDRGAERLALITGRIHSIPPKSSDNSIADSSLPSDFSDPTTHLANQTTVSSIVKDEDVVSKLPNHDPAVDTGNERSSVEFPSLQELERSINALRVADIDVSGNAQSSLASSRDQNSAMATSSTASDFRPATRQNRFLTPSQITSAITVSEVARAFCSLVVATLVVLSCLGFPILGSNIIKSIISLRPLYIVLLTNLTLVFARLLLKNQRSTERVVEAERQAPSTGRNDWAEQAGKALEVGLLMQKAIDALFMDCSIYAIILICGLSFVKQLGV